MSDELDPRARKWENGVKAAGVVIVAALASAAVVVAGVSVIAAGLTTVAALAVVNYVVPVGARWIALQRQKALTGLAEKFSEETIREDETSEGRRVQQLESSYKISRAELEGAQQELREQMRTATTDEKELLQSQIDTLQGVIEDAEQTLLQRKQDFAELQRINKLYIAFHRSAAAMERAQGAERNPEELQRLETARASIKNRMRQAMAGKKIDAMNNMVRQKPDIAQVAQLRHIATESIPLNVKEVKDALPHRR